MKLSDAELAAILKSEEEAALDYEGELSKRREKLLEYYNLEPYGDEVEGQSRAVTSDVSDVVEWMLPSLMRIFTQGKNIAQFEAAREEYDEEAKQKTQLANHVFLRENPGVMILHNMFKDALLQYVGVVKVCYEVEKTPRVDRYQGLSANEYALLKAHDDVDAVEDVEQYDVNGEPYYNCTTISVQEKGGVKVYNIPPEEFMISKQARDFERPVFIGHRSPKRRSDLIEMGFKPGEVAGLPADEYFNDSREKLARYENYSSSPTGNDSNHKANDLIYLGEYYTEVDMDGDGITELWKFFYAGNKILDKEQVISHPFAACVPIPIPHRAIGSCPAEQVADLQYRKSVLVRQMLDNVYQSNYPRVMHSNMVNLDDLLTPRPGGTIEIDTDAADVGGHAVPLAIPNMTQGIMTALEYTDMEREIRTGVTRYSQGLDAESLNKTATGFKGIMDASQQRLDLIARLFADGGVKQIFQKITELLARHQDQSMQVRVLGQPLEINPASWRGQAHCRIDVGLGSGDRQEKIINLNNILAVQERFMQQGLVLSDQSKLYKTLSKIIDEVGLKDVGEYFNDPEVPEETLFAQNQQLVAMVQQLQAQINSNPLAEAELIKAQAKMAEVEGKETNSMRQFVMKMAQTDKQFAAELAKDLTEMELKYSKDVPGALV